MELKCIHDKTLKYSTVCAFNECELSRWFISIQRQLISIFSMYDNSDVAHTSDCKVQTLINFFATRRNSTRQICKPSFQEHSFAALWFGLSDPLKQN